jgi:D-alanine-D-alanine ligase
VSEAIHLRILAGGRSTEHDASIGSLVNVLDNVGDAICVDEVLYVLREGGRARRHRGGIEPWPRDEMALRNAGEPLDMLALLADLRRPDCAFVINLLHGDEGEDGAWSGLAEVLDIAGSFESTAAASITMSKFAQTAVAERFGGLSTPGTWLVDGASSDETLDAIVERLGNASAVTKPDAMGASHLTTLVGTPGRARLRAFTEHLASFGIRGIVQRYVQGREVTCGVIAFGGEPLVLPVVEAITSGNFLGHDEKHVAGLVRAAVLSAADPLARTTRAASLALFRLFGLTYLARFDFIARDGELWFLEANSIPGLMLGSAFPVMLDAASMTIEDALAGLAATAAPHRARRKHLIYDVHR